MEIRLSAIFNLLLIFSGTIFAARCANPSVRKEIRELTVTERRNFFKALRTLHTQRSGRNGLTGWEELSQIHLEYNYDIHGVPCFLPWHRVFLKDLERRLQQIDPSVRMPYWDWTVDSQSPERSPILSPGYFGSNGFGNEMCVRDGVFANQEFSVPEYHCLARNYDGGDRIGAFYPPEALDRLIDVSRDYDTFRQDLEGAPHARVHMGIGGDGGDLKTMHAPNDPLFYLHHCFLDMVWHEWQLRHPDRFRDYGGVKDDGSRGLASDSLPPYRSTVAQTFDILDEEYCYTYPRWGRGRREEQQRRPQQTPPPQRPQGQSPNPANTRNTPLARPTTQRPAAGTANAASVNPSANRSATPSPARANTTPNTRNTRAAGTRAAAPRAAGTQATRPLGRRQLSGALDAVNNAISGTAVDAAPSTPDNSNPQGGIIPASTISNISGNNVITQTVQNTVNTVSNVNTETTNTVNNFVTNTSNIVNVLLLGLLDPYNRDEKDKRYRQPPPIEDSYLDMMKIDRDRVRQWEYETNYYLNYIGSQPGYKPQATVHPKKSKKSHNEEDDERY
jgi:tyrosinase